MNYISLCNGSLKKIRYNRIESRVLEELSVDDATLQTGSNFYFDILERQTFIENRTREQIQAVKELQDLFPGRKKPIIIKGFTCAVLCNNSKHVRYSRDLDVFYYDINVLKQALISLGYHEQDKIPAPHEDSFFIRDNIIIEIHKYFPVLLLPEYEKGNFATNKQLNLPDINIERIDYQLLLDNSLVVSNEVADTIMITDVEMTIFLICAHIYKNLFWQPYKTPKMRIIELVEIYELVTLPTFNIDSLLLIANKLHAKHILTYVFKIIEEALHLDIPNELRGSVLAVIKLSNDSYSPYKLVDQSYFAQLPFLSFDQMIDIVGFTECVFDTEYNTSSLSNVYYASTSIQSIDYSFSVRLIENKVCYQMSINRPIQDGDNFCIMLDDDVFSHIWFDHYPNCIRVYGVDNYKLFSDGSGYRIEMYFDDLLFFPDKAVIAVGTVDNNKQIVTVSPLSLQQ